MRHAAFVLLFASLGLVAGCSKSSNQQTSTSADKVKVDRKSNNEVAVKIESRSGDNLDAKFGNSGVALPAGFPSDFPLPPKASVKMASGSGSDLVVGLLSHAEVAETTTYYQTELKRAGWTPEDSMPMGEGVMLEAKKAPLTCSLMINKGEGGKGSYIQISISRE